MKINWQSISCAVLVSNSENGVGPLQLQLHIQIHHHRGHGEIFFWLNKYFIILLQGVGKSCLLHQFTEKKCNIHTTSKHQLCLWNHLFSEFLPVSSLNHYGWLTKSLKLLLSHGGLSAHHRSGVWNENHWGGDTFWVSSLWGQMCFRCQGRR